MMTKIIKLLKQPKIIILYILNFKIFRIIPDKTYIKIKYRLTMEKKLNLNNPLTLNEKIQWLKLYDRKEEYTKLVDKYEVRNYIKETIGEEYLIPLLGVYDRFEDIDFDKLPNSFVLKPTHTSGDIYICKNKADIDYKYLKKLVNKWLKRRYYWLHREWPYKNIKPRIICEQYMVDESGIELKDYKFFCFHGKVKCLFVGSGRMSESGVKADYYDPEWNPLPFERTHPKSGKSFPKPKELDKMIEVAEKLASNFIFVRVDLYLVNGQVYFGELTFHPASGYGKFEPEYYDYYYGSLLNLYY